MEEINWLQFSDFHAGMKGQAWMWPQFKSHLFEDLKKLYSESGPWDIAFVTGDLTYSGTEFQRFEEVFGEIWQVFEKLGCAPILYVLPGNHDLVRPPQHNPFAKVLLNWQLEKEIQDIFWSTNNEYLAFVQELFANYLNWTKTTKLPIGMKNDGLLPGDFSAKEILNGISLGVVGLNTSFLQLNGTVGTNSLELHPNQLNALVNDNPSQWLAENDFSVLLTHHDVDWLNQDSKNNYNSFICPPGSFDLHMCGHLHQPTTLATSEGGGTARYVLKAPSLFGLETWGDSENRILGYFAGKFIKEGEAKSIKLWPRKLIKKIAGHYRMEVDQEFDTESGTITIPIKNAVYEKQPLLNSAIVLTTSLVKITESNTQKLSNIPKFPLFEEKHHKVVRVKEQELLTERLKRERCGWVFADWGLGKEGFIRSVIYGETIENQKQNPVVISLPCDDVTSIERLLDLVQDFCNMPLQELCHLSADRHLFLIFDNLSPELTSKKTVSDLDNIFKTIVDFSENIIVIPVNRIRVHESRFDGVELKALTIPELRQYISSNPKNTVETLEVEYVDRLHSMSQGLPLYVDYLLKLLCMSSLDDLYDLDVDFSIKNIENEERIPNSFKFAVTNLQNSQDDVIKRSFDMLKVLSVLPNGETFASIKHFFHKRPFYLSNVTALVDLGLLEAIPITIHAKDILPESARYGDHNSTNLLRVPRQVRDYVETLLTEEETLEITKAAADLLFGTNWRRGKIRVANNQSGKGLGTKPSGLGNEHIIARTLLWHAIKQNDKRTIKQTALIGKNYCQKLLKQDRYRDAIIATEELCHFLSETDERREMANLQFVLGKALRMASKRREAVSIFENLIEKNIAVFSKDEQAAIWLNIALSEETDDNEAEAIAAAKKVQSLSNKGSSAYQQASAILLEYKKGVDKYKLLKQLEKQCRNNKHFTVANNICLDLSYHADCDEKIRLVETVINCKEEGTYNKVRAIVAKIQHLATPERLHMVSTRDLYSISLAYTYLFAQRFNHLFNSCHKAIWELLKCDKQYDNMIRLYMHSSFIWRIRGDIKTELVYVDEIKKLVDLGKINTSSKEYLYYYGRVSSSQDKLSQAL